MADSILCCLFLCESCKWPSSLRLDRIWQQIQDRGVQPNDYPPVAFVCPNCTHTQIRSLDPDSPYYQVSDKLVTLAQTEDAAFAAWLPACEGNCIFHIPMYLVGKTLASKKAYEEWIRDGEKEINLHCPKGHSIHWRW
jgi:hypothetical protein